MSMLQIKEFALLGGLDIIYLDNLGL